jgi:hypothetical protein
MLIVFSRHKPLMQNSTVDVAGVRTSLGWSTIRLADELGVAPLTIQRWEKKYARRDEGGHRSKNGRPTDVPRHLELALQFILLREGKKRGAPTIAKLRLPDVLGATLPFVAKEEKLFSQWGLDVQIDGCDTGEEALHAITEGRADIAGAGKGLIKNAQDRALVDLGTVMRSQGAFQILHPRLQRSTSTKGINKSTRGNSRRDDSGRKTPAFSGEFSDYRGGKILYPRGSDLRNLLEEVRRRVDGDVAFEDVDRQDAVDALKAAQGSTKLFYVAWEPLVTRVAAALAPDSYGKRPFELKDAAYEFHLVCARPWCDTNPRAVLGLICALARAELAFKEAPGRWVRDIWTTHWKIPTGLVGEPEIPKLVEEITFMPSSAVLRVLESAKPVIIDRASLAATTLRQR